MGLQSWWQQRSQQKIARYLAGHTAAALDVLRHDPTLATTVVSQAMDLQAATAKPDRESLQFPDLGYLGLGNRQPLGTALPKPTPFNLRRFSEYPPARRAINALCNPLLDLAWAIVPTDPRYDETKPATWPEELEARSVAMTYCLTHPHPGDSWRTMLESVLEDICVGGYGAIEVKRTGNPADPLRLWPVDGQSLRINVHWNGDAEAPRYTQSLGYAGLTVASMETVQLLDDELAYIRLNPRTNTPFGLGYLESAFLTVNAFIGAFDFAQRRASNATPDYLIFLGENIDIPATRAWQQYWQNMIEGYGKTPIIGGGVNPKVLPLRGGTRQDPLYLHWQEWLVRVIAMAFGISPLKMGLERNVNRATSVTMEQEDWETASPIAQAFADALTTHLLWKVLGWEDLKFSWQLRTADDARQATILKTRWESNAITIDEQRALWDIPPLPDGRGIYTMLEAAARAKIASKGPEDTGAADSMLTDPLENALERAMPAPSPSNDVAGDGV